MPTRPQTLSAICVALLTCVIGGTACTGADLPQESNLDRLRILAVRATPAEPSPGDEVTFEALTFAPDAHAVGLLWTLCQNPADCPSTEFRESAAARVQAGEADLAAGLFGVQPGPTPSYQVPIGVLDPVPEPQRREGIEVSIGILGVDLDEPSSTEEWGRKAVPISESAAPNRNPDLDGITVDGVEHVVGDPIRVSAGEGIDLDTLPADTAAQTYTYINTSGETETREEALQMSWYSDIGTINIDDGPGGGLGNDGEVQGDWIAPDGAAEGVLIAVVRDGRGGTGWLSFDVVVE
ncbi:MAG: hypothetical protein AB8H79_00015 [Myxococcota bacterium]